MKPRIAITCKRSSDMTNYIKTVEEYGGEPILLESLHIPTHEHNSLIPEFLENSDGILLTGGGDIDPTHYFQERRSATSVSRSRDALEIRLCQKALETDIPVFGICRGIQVMSVAMWGNLYQDINRYHPKPVLRHPKFNGEDARHEIQIKIDSKLYEIVGKSVDEVNSAHHQAVDDVGKDFVVTARSSDDVIEAIENRSKPFVLGVQYHPERMTATDGFLEHRRKLFKAFIKAAKNWQSKKNGS
ncbi:gamma-glutamyl-gamma-aminobutyrate hydrolase family protein [Candidatus Poribacteria bacterium]|nr:gamma-glutamyl-gamma-aminobutyrate hydrolase family protein [Candidatus Poribacteria bacterium]MYB63785.1 gamma-glutamyl-gamma-aminobutyrate hydrolase family protein [Candidatus Poribacteria bacterium]MYF55660.1 gamma-glutamyl-gamma-aminobutyrate hydrolase family protein [Candidatus Poribacteria bacterium]